MVYGLPYTVYHNWRTKTVHGFMVLVYGLWVCVLLVHCLTWLVNVVIGVNSFSNTSYIHIPSSITTRNDRWIILYISACCCVITKEIVYYGLFMYCWYKHLSQLVNVAFNQYSMVYIFKSVVWQQNNTVKKRCSRWCLYLIPRYNLPIIMITNH